MSAMSEILIRLLFDYRAMTRDEIEGALGELPLKTLRWLARSHEDNRFRKWCLRRSNVEVGAGSVINCGIVISDSYQPLVTVGERCSIAGNVSLIAESGPNNSRLMLQPYVAQNLARAAHIRIEDDVWIGVGATILPGVTVGKAAVVGAMALVTHDVEPAVIVGGVPARPIRKLD